MGSSGKEEVIIVDSIHGLPYSWDPETRLLGLPDHPDFAADDLVEPIPVP